MRTQGAGPDGEEQLEKIADGSALPLRAAIRHREQEETFVVLSGTLSMYLGDPPERHDVRAGGVVHVQPGTALQSANHGSVDLLVYAYGFPPEDQHADILDSVA